MATLDTINAIAALLTLFTDEEKEGLKITLGTKEITLKDQFVGRWERCRPRYTGNTFLYKAAHILNGNKLLFTRAIEFNKPEFQEKLKVMLSNPDSYVKVKETKTDNTDTLKHLGLSQSGTTGLSRALNKIRSGASESGQEYTDLEKEWEKEDLKALSTGLPPRRLGTQISLDPTKKGIDQISLGLSVRDNQALTYFEPTGEDTSLDENKPALQSVNINQTRTQALGTTQADTLAVTDQKKELDGKVVAKDIVTIEALQLMTATKIKDPRETAFQKLDVLFTSPCL